MTADPLTGNAPAAPAQPDRQRNHGVWYAAPMTGTPQSRVDRDGPLEGRAARRPSPTALYA